MTRIHALYFSFSILLFACSEGNESKQQDAKSNLQVDGYLVRNGEFNNALTLTAELLPNEYAELKAPVSGQVLDFYFKEGQHVKKGDLLVRLDDRSWNAQLMGLKAQLKNAENDLSRKKALLDIGGSSQEDTDLALANVETLQAQIRQLEVNIDLANVRAPFSGTIGMRNFSKGSYLREGDVITLLTETDQLKIDFAVPQMHQSEVKPGKKVQLLVSGDTLEATVYAVNPIVDPKSRSIQVRAQLSQQKHSPILPGGFAQVVFSTSYSADALLIPTQAVIPELNRQVVYLLKNGKAEKQVVETAGRNADVVQIVTGLQEHDTVIVTGLMQLREGMNVTLQSLKN